MSIKIIRSPREEEGGKEGRKFVQLKSCHLAGLYQAHGLIWTRANTPDIRGKGGKRGNRGGEKGASPPERNAVT